MTPYILYRDARLLELDMLDLCELCIDGQAFPDFRPLMRKLSARAGELANGLEKVVPLEQEIVKNAARWELFNSPDITVKESVLGFVIIRKRPQSSTIIGRGKTLKEAVDGVLGIVG
jgi:hypothetical protein